VATLRERAEKHGPISDAEADWLTQLAADWQIIADLSFADLVMWRAVPDGYVAIAQCRPSTGPTVHQDDVVGTFAPAGKVPTLRRAEEEKTLVATREPRWDEHYAVREDVMPVVMNDAAIAVLTREVPQAASRSSSRLELNYKGAADDILAMVIRGEFPMPTSITGPLRGAPRVGDGIVRLDDQGHVTYASPNALSCFHRLGVMGTIVGRSLPRLTAEVVGEDGSMDETLANVVMGRTAWRTDLEARGGCLSVRAIPTLVRGTRTGALLLVRDVTELRRRERELITKDATIREIHHRVKNNLQTVAALLRLQSRRVDAPEAKAALAEAMRRVSTIALVHETLSGTLDEHVNFDDLVTSSVRLVADVATADVRVKVVREGEFGMIPAAAASSLALVVMELVTNAVEHGFRSRGSGTVTIRAHRDGDLLSVVISDDGVGLTAKPSGLGSQIVTTLVENELGGSIEWRALEKGSEVELKVAVGNAR
jgi:two-component sensor histidine kinase